MKSTYLNSASAQESKVPSQPAESCTVYHREFILGLIGIGYVVSPVFAGLETIKNHPQNATSEETNSASTLN